MNQLNNQVFNKLRKQTFYNQSNYRYIKPIQVRQQQRVQMGKKGRQNNNRRGHNNNTDSQSKGNNNYPKASEQQLQVECLELYQLLTNKTKILKEQKLDFCYIISTKWLEDWKQYAGFYNLSQDDQKKHKKVGKKHPGKINYELVAQNKDFYNIPMHNYNYLNTVISEKKQQDDDFIAIAKQIWDIFASKYDHVEIIRPKRETKKGNVVYDGSMLQLQVVIVNFSDSQLIKGIQTVKQMPKRDLDDEFPCQKLQLSTLWKIQDLYKFIGQYCDNVYQQKNYKIWKVEGYATVGQVQRALWEGINKKIPSFPIPCRELTEQKCKDLDLDDFLKTYYSLVLEVGKPHLKGAKVPSQLQGYCQECVKKKPLIIWCTCEQVFYCSEECRVVDQVWHQNVCKRAFESQDDQVYHKKSVNLEHQQLPTCGLENLGNTCYMNSVLQALASVEQIASYFSANKYQKEIDQKEFEQNKGRLLDKYAKFFKQLAESKQSFSPWSLKGQINYFLPPFKGFKQHDANDFLVNFISSLNEQLKKQQGKMFHRIFQDNFLGQFDSFIKCPVCTIQISNDEVFSQITLPIKQKVKTQTTNYVIYENARKVIRGKCQVQSTWEQMRKNLALKGSCLLMGAREGQAAVDVDENQNVDKTIKKLKRELIFYPNCNYSDFDVFLSVIPITQKNMCGQRMKAPYGYPAIININLQMSNLGTFLVQIIKEFCQKEIYEQAIKIKQNYFIQIEQTFNSKINEKQDSKSTQQTQVNDKVSKQQDPTMKISQDSSNQLKQLMKRHKISIFINDLKRTRNTCNFCKKKCDGCELPIDFSLELKQYLQGKTSQVSFQIILGYKIQQQKVQKDIAKSNETTLHDCIQLFTQPQQLDQQNAWWCSSCQDLRLAYKQLTVKKLPKILVIHLNRFKAEGDKKVKNSQSIQYEQYEEFCGKRYQLLSVIVHEGSTEGGHYWSICRRNDKFYVFNDDKVTHTQKYCSRNAYILFYRQVSY